MPEASTTGPSAQTWFMPKRFVIHVPVVLIAVGEVQPDGGFSIEVPALSGCITEADTPEELHKNLAEAIAVWLEVKQEKATGFVYANVW